MQERYMGLARSGMIYARQNSHYTASKQTLDDVIHYYKKILKDTPQNGHAAFLLAEAYFLKFDYAQSTKYLMQSYQFYPISGRLAKARHRLSFRLLSYFPEDVSAYRDQDYKIIQMLNKGAQ